MFSLDCVIPLPRIRLTDSINPESANVLNLLHHESASGTHSTPDPPTLWTHSTLDLPLHLLPTGNLVYKWLQQQCTDCETKSEYDHSCVMLESFLRNPQTVNDIGAECIAAIHKLQNNLRAKEHKIANHFRMVIRNCMDACTTSPVESANASIKHGPWKVHSNMGLDVSTNRMVDGIESRLDRRQGAAHRELKRTSYSSRAPTKDDIIKKGQGLIDREFDSRLHLKSAQIGPEEWAVWDFDSWMEDFAEKLGAKEIDKDSLYGFLPVFLRVRIVKVNRGIDNNFLKCSCFKWKRLGVPCRCFFRTIDNGKLDLSEMIDLSMVDIRYWKVFNARYGDGTKLSEYLYRAQVQSFKYENDGIQVSNSLLSKVVGGHTQTYPILGPNTTMEDFNEMMHARSEPYFTLQDLLNCRKDGVDWEDNMLLSGLDHGSTEERATLSATASAMQAAVRAAVDEETAQDATKSNKDLFMAEYIRMGRFVADNDCVDKDMMSKFLTHVKSGYEDIIRSEVQKKSASQKKSSKENQRKKRSGEQLEMIGSNNKKRKARETRKKALGHY